MFKTKSIFILLALCLFACVSCQKEEARLDSVQQEEVIQDNPDFTAVIERLQNDGSKSTWYTYPQWPFGGISADKTYSIASGADRILIIVWNTGSSSFTCTVSTNIGQEDRRQIAVGGSETFIIYGGGWSSVTIQNVLNTTSFSGVATISYRYWLS